MIALQTTEWTNEENCEKTRFENSATFGAMDSVTLAYRTIRRHGGPPFIEIADAQYLGRIGTCA